MKNVSGLRRGGGKAKAVLKDNKPKMGSKGNVVVNNNDAQRLLTKYSPVVDPGPIQVPDVKNGTDDSSQDSKGTPTSPFVWAIPKRKSLSVPAKFRRSLGLENLKIQEDYISSEVVANVSAVDTSTKNVISSASPSVNRWRKADSKNLNMKEHSERSRPEIIKNRNEPAGQLTFSAMIPDEMESPVKGNSSRRKSLPLGTISMLPQKIRRLRRVSELPKLFTSEPHKDKTISREVETLPPPPPKLTVHHGMLCVAGTNEIDRIPDEEKIIQLVYGDNNNNDPHFAAIPDELVLLLVKTPEVERLELRGYWDFNNGPTNFREYLEHFPRLPYLNCVSLPKTGANLGKMGSLFVGLFGQHLQTLEVPMQFLEETCPVDLSKLIPNLKHLKTFNSSVEMMSNLMKFSCNSLETLIIGEFQQSQSHIGIPWEILKTVVCKFGQQLVKFEFEFPVVDDEGELLDDEDVEVILKKYMLLY